MTELLHQAYLAILRDNIAELKTVLAAKKVNVDDYYNKEDTLLILAVRKERLDAVKILLSEHANINKKNAYGNTPLITAVNLEHFEIAQYLIEQGADLDIRDPDGNVALWRCLFYFKDKNYAALAQLFIRHNANLDSKNKVGKTPRDIIIENGLKLMV